MTPIRRKNILSMCQDWQAEFENMSIKDCFFALYDDRDITGSELDYLMDWMTL